MLQEINIVIERLGAGKNSFTDKELKSIYSRIYKILYSVNSETESEVLDGTTRILNLIAEYGVLNEFSKELNVKLLYKLWSTFNKPLNNDDAVQKFIFTLLNLIKQNYFLQHISDDSDWEKLISDLIDISGFNTYQLIKQRTEQYGNKSVFGLIKGTSVTHTSWNSLFDTIKVYGVNLRRLISDDNNIIAVLSENSLEMAKLDLACLATGIKNVMIPANSVPQHIEFILNETKAEAILVSNEKQLAKLKSVKKKLPALKQAVIIEGSSAEEWVQNFDEFLEDSGKNHVEVIIHRKMDEHATLMYTSGTTGNPKGIMFSQKNIVSKRFYRALALNEIGDNDRFLCFLPLFHTFGRYFEMMGSLFWGATYYFMENPSLTTMLSNMQTVKPTVFISIPKKWIQLYEHISTQTDIEFGSDKNIKAAIDEATGGSLRWGLSAAGYLDPVIFRFFQKYNIELMSGFGMTEATGGITMTPPFRYRENSLGKALPGIKIKVADDGELLVKGEYIMLGYYGKSYEECFDPEGYFATGDIMRMDEDGFIQILDRKKDIYKNVRGETIAPQKIENLFADFDYISRVFLVGDGKPYNTVLIYADYSDEDCVLKSMNTEQVQDYFSTVIVTVNNFLAPFERILDFRLINRPFTEEKGELTPKGTFKRKVIESNFDETISQLYVKPHYDITINGLQIRVPNWFLREISTLYRDISTDGDYLTIPKLKKKLRIVSCADNKSYILGSYCYQSGSKVFELQPFLTNPALWAGNNDLYNFVGDQLLQWTRNVKTDSAYQINYAVYRELDPAETEENLQLLLDSGEQSFYGIHLATTLLFSDKGANVTLPASYLKFIASNNIPQYKNLVKHLIYHPELIFSREGKQEVLRFAMDYFNETFISEILPGYTSVDNRVLNRAIIQEIITKCDIKANLDPIVETIRNYTDGFTGDYNLDSPVPAYFDLLTEFGIRKPTYYEKLRQIFVSFQISENESLSDLATEFRTTLRYGFRKWLGENQQIAVDIETGEEYTWNDVIIFDENIPEDDKQRITDSITYTPVLREAIFLFSGGKRILLDNITPSGIWISYLREYSNKNVYKVIVQTRTHGSFDLILNLNKNSASSVLKEINWLILAGSRYYTQELIEDFGGYWDEYDIWSARFVPGKTVTNFISREVNKKETAYTRLSSLWPFFVWNAAAAYFNFWKLTGHRQILSDASPNNFVIPTHDYQSGTKVMSLSERVDFTNFYEMFHNFNEHFIKNFETKYTFLKRNNIYDYIFAGFINTEGEQEGLSYLKNLLNELLIAEHPDENFIRILKKFILFVEDKSFIPKQLYFAVQRFHRWEKINKNASDSALAKMLADLYNTYNLAELEAIKPETRTRLYFETVFATSSKTVKEEIKKVYLKQSKEILSADEVVELFSDLITRLDLTKHEKFFLTRLSYPHIKPSDSAVIIRSITEGKELPNLVIEHNDSEGIPFFIRKPISPREISRLHQLFIEANLIVNFKDDHHFLVAISERGYIIGGLFYSFTDKDTVFMDKIVVSNRYRRKGISELLMEELFQRLRNENIHYVTTGFFRPEYFYRFGFNVEKKYSGLVKNLHSLQEGPEV